MDKKLRRSRFAITDAAGVNLDDANSIGRGIFDSPVERNSMVVTEFEVTVFKADLNHFRPAKTQAARGYKAEFFKRGKSVATPGKSATRGVPKAS